MPATRALDWPVCWRSLPIVPANPEPDGRMLLPAGWTHEALGRELGLRRETVSRALRTLAREGRVDQRGHRLVVGRLRPGRPQPRPREQIVERAGDQNC